MNIVRNSAKKSLYVCVTGSTGMASLLFAEGVTIHHCSVYGDGHLHSETFIEEIKISSTY